MPGCVRRKEQQTAAFDRDVVLAQQIVVPVGDFRVRYAVNFRPHAELWPVVVQVIPPIEGAKHLLSPRGGNPPTPTDRVEIGLRKRLDASGGVRDRLGNDPPVPAATPATQRIPQGSRSEQSLLHRGQHDHPRTTLGDSFARGVDEAPRQPRSRRKAAWIDVLRSQFGGPSDADFPLGGEGAESDPARAGRAGKHQGDAVRLQAAQAVVPGSRQSVQQRARWRTQQGDP